MSLFANIINKPTMKKLKRRVGICGGFTNGHQDDDSENQPKPKVNSAKVHSENNGNPNHTPQLTPRVNSAKVHPAPDKDGLEVEDLEECKSEEAYSVSDYGMENGDLQGDMSILGNNSEQLDRDRTYSLLSPGLTLYPDVTEGETLHEKFSELKDQQRTLRLAAAHVEDALMGRGSLGKSRAMFLPKYQKMCFTIYDNTWWRRLLFFVIILHSVLAFFEPTQDNLRPGQTQAVIWVLNVICLVIYVVDVVLQIIFFHWKTFFKSAEAKRARVEFVYIILFTIDFIIFVLQEILQLRLLQVFRCVRPAMLYAKSRNFAHIFDVCSSIILSLGKVLMLVFLYVLVFAAAAVHLYMDNYHNIGCSNATGNAEVDAKVCQEDEKEVYTGAFDNVGIAVLRMFVLVSSENYPAIMIPAYKVSNANFIFFGVYIYVGIFVITSVLIAQVVEKYWYYSKQHVKAERMHERAELAKAWTLLDPDGDGHVTTQDRRVRQMLVYVRPTLSEEEVQELVDYLDEDGDGDVDAFEWTTRLTDALNYDFIRDPQPWTVKSPKWLSSLTRRSRMIVTSRPFNFIVLFFIVIHSLLLCLKWRGMESSTELVIQCIRTTVTILFLPEMVIKVLGLGTDLCHKLEVFDLCCTSVGVLANCLWYLVPFVTSVPDPGTYHAILVVVSGAAIFLRLGFNSRPTKRLVESFLKLAPVLLDLILFVVVLIYFYAVIGMELFFGFDPDYSIDSVHWGYGCELGFATLGCSMLEVFQICTTSNWHEIMNAVMLATTPWSAIYFVTCFCIVCLVVMNLFVAMTIEAFKHLIPADEDNKSVNIQHHTFSQNALALLDAVFAPSRTSVRPTDRRVSLAFVNERRRSMFPSPGTTPHPYQESVLSDRQRHLSLRTEPSPRASTVSQPSTQEAMADSIDRPRRSVVTKRRRQQLIKERLAHRKELTGNRFRVIAAYRKSRDGEVDLHVGDEVKVTQSDGDYWRGCVRGEEGWFPATHVVEFARRRPRREENEPVYANTIKSDTQESHTSSTGATKVKVKGGHGDWTRQILGDLTVMNPSEMLEINRILRGGGKNVSKAHHQPARSQSKRLQLAEVNETAGEGSHVKSPPNSSSKVQSQTPYKNRSSNAKIKIEVESPTRSLNSDPTSTDTDTTNTRDSKRLDVKRPSTSNTKSRNRPKSSEVPDWAKQFMDVHRRRLSTT